MGFVGLIVTYTLGVLSLPLALSFLFVHAYFTLPGQSQTSKDSHDLTDDLRSADDDAQSIRSGRSLADLTEKFHRTSESDVAAGYFAVCREYVPGGVNGKPPERTTPAGSVIAAESPSVYQSMYRSLFDRRQPPTLEPTNAVGKTMKRARNVFYVVLRHGHLMLYEDSSQIEVKYVISLEHHDISIYSGGDDTPEGELFIKRNSIMLSNKTKDAETMSRPFHFFSENCSDKESFYFALLQNQDIKPAAQDNPPRPLEYEPKHIIGLVQRLHSSEEQLQTRWLNAVIGRLFLALYKTSEVEDFIRRKVAKKIARVKKPAFLSHIILQKIDLGQSAPQIINPRLKDLTINGDCCVEADIRYNGNLRLEIATTARIDLGARFKAREVSLVLAITVKKLNGHGLVKFKPVPSNRLWMSFETMPDMEMTVEPIVSSRQITYAFILRTIESRIREVLAETIVLPHWDDHPFSDTSGKVFRGGIWAPSPSNPEPPTEQTTIPDEAPEDEAEAAIDPSVLSTASGSMPDGLNEAAVGRSAVPDASDNADIAPVSESLEPLTEAANVPAANAQRAPAPPKALRSRSFASAANPLVSMDTANVDSAQLEQKDKRKRQQDAASAMMALNEKARPSSPPEAPVMSVMDEPNLWQNFPKSDGFATEASNKAESNTAVAPSDIVDRVNVSSSASSISGNGPHTAKPTLREESSRTFSLNSRDTAFPEKKQTATALNAATMAARNWGWGVLSRKTDSKTRTNPNPDRIGTPERPIGRGRPLPPPGEPLPLPQAMKSKTMPVPSPKKPVLPPRSQRRGDDSGSKHAPAAPPLPARSRRSLSPVEDMGAGKLLVVKAPPHTPETPVLDDRSEVPGIEALGKTGDKVSTVGVSHDLEGEVHSSRTGVKSHSTSLHSLDREEDESIAAWQGNDSND